MPTLDSIGLVSAAKELNIISIVTYLLPLLVCFWRWHSLRPAYRVPIFCALLISSGLNVLSEVGRQVWHNNILVLYLITWTETLFLATVYYQALHSRRSRQLLLGASVLFGVVAVAESLGRSFYGAQTYTRLAQSILLIGAALAYFEQVLQELRNIRLSHDPMFLVSVGVTLYYSGTLMVFVLEDSMQDPGQANQIWLMFSIASVLLILLNVLLARALYRAGTKAPPLTGHLPS